MTVRMSLEDQIKFLLSCVKWSVNGKIDFDQVASECDVVSKGAAAKRYERMVKQAGAQGGLLDSSVPPSRKDPLTLKVSKKRKPDEMAGTLKHDEDEKRVLPAPKRPRNEHQQTVKQEPPISNHSPYMFHPAMPPQGPFMSRAPLPMNMFPGMPYTMPPQMQPFPQRPHGLQFPFAPHPMFPGMHNNYPYMQPMHQQVHPYQVNQNMLSQGQDNISLGLLDDMQNYDFVNGDCEYMLSGEHLPDGPTSSDPMTSKPLEPTLMYSSMDMTDHIKAEPCRASPTPFQDFEARSTTAVPQQELRSEMLAPVIAAPATLVLNEPGMSTSNEPEKHTTDMAATLMPKEEENNTSCIFISD